MVIFNSNGGSISDSQYIKEGFIFKHWTLNGSEYDFTTTVNNDIELVAKWRDN